MLWVELHVPRQRHSLSINKMQAIDAGNTGRCRQWQGGSRNLIMYRQAPKLLAFSRCDGRQCARKGLALLQAAKRGRKADEPDRVILPEELVCGSSNPFRACKTLLWMMQNNPLKRILDRARGGYSTYFTKSKSVHTLKGLALPRASHSGEIALAGSRRLHSMLAAAPVL